VASAVWTFFPLNILPKKTGLVKPCASILNGMRNG
jgi:hypothetical protein